MNEWTQERPVRTPGLSAKEEILARVRSALATPRRDEITEAQDVPRDYQRADDKQEQRTAPEKMRDVLVQRLEDYTAIVHRTTAAEAPAIIAAALGEARGVVVPSQLPEDWTSAVDAELLVDDGSASPHRLDALDAVLTGCHTAIAITGTIVLRGDGRSGRRAISLVPDHHVIVVEAEQVVLGVPKGIERMAEDPTAAWTMISGPSATSDIELSRVEGVHGPRRLEVVLIEPEPEPDPAPEAATDPASASTKESTA
ncbi:LUD domain-containing protein [Brachybacterium sp. YJGR34]|uniref:LutC/YkgG family protein n=1 Tax=Brachybacterium sp. YJGR34 TaxID=2059911 RepID=UPI000E0C6A9F|nr:LUD domain-containing protein [Brachybacterium sp. YJGR34]